MATVKRFEDLECWQEARKLVNMIYTITRSREFEKDFELKNQITRSAISVMANIAEGFHRSSKKDFMKFLDYSRASIAETISHCFIGFDQHYISEQHMHSIKGQSEIVWKQVNNFIAYLHRCTASSNPAPKKRHNQ